MSFYSTKDTTVVILSAGHGTRMLPLTKNTPKPLLKIGDLSLIEHHLISLKKLGFENIVINIAYLGHQIRDTLLGGEKYQLNIQYSDEADTGALETAGGIKSALPLISSNEFLVINADIWTDYNFTQLLERPLIHDACLVMITNPEHNPDGDFSLEPKQENSYGLLNSHTDNNSRVTYSGIGLYKKDLFKTINSGKQALGPILKTLSEQQRLSGIYYQGVWKDIGTPERLEEIRQNFKKDKV